MLFPRFSILLSLALTATTSSVAAHEAWLAPQSYQIDSGAPLEVQLKNGQEFKGSNLGYFPNSVVRLDLIQNAATTPYKGRLGDIPAIETTGPAQDGLLVISYQSTVTTLKYKEWDKFMTFAKHKDFAGAAADHAAAGWPRTDFREAYARYAKTLIAVGSGAGSDAPTGMETEFVALTNPFDAAFDGTMRVQVLYQGAPRGDAQVEVFDRTASGDVTITLTRTDTDGIAQIPVTSGHEYLLDAVVLRPYTGDKDAVWETLWAALTFKIP